MELFEEPEVKVIYSKRYPSWGKLHREAQLEEQAQDNDSPTMSQEEVAAKWNEFVARWNYMVGNSVYVLRPDKIDNLDTFISLAIKLSTRYEISMDIKDHFYYTSVILYLDCGLYRGDFLPMIAQLINMSDEIDSGILKNGSHDFSLSLDYFTHDRYIPSME